MSAIGPKRTCASALHMSVFEGKADMPIAASAVVAAVSNFKEKEPQTNAALSFLTNDVITATLVSCRPC